MERIILLIPLFFTIIYADELSDCKCMEGWRAEKDDSGGVNCYGVILKSILPCNLVVKPDCVCSEESTSVVQDSSGTFCVRIKEGVHEKKWDCENKKDWLMFYGKHPEEKPPTDPPLKLLTL